MAAEVKRRFVHASGAVVPLAYVAGVLEWGQVRYLAAVAVSIAVILEVLRLFVGLDWSIYDELTRPYEQDNPAGYALYMVGYAVAAWGFEPAVGVPAMLMLCFGDPISGALSAGELRDVKQTYVLLVMFGVCLLLALPFVRTTAAVLGAVAATVADGVKPVVAGYVIDDNVTIPVGAAVAMWVAIAYLPV